MAERFDWRPTYIVEREIPGAAKMAEAELRELSLQAAASRCIDIGGTLSRAA